MNILGLHVTGSQSSAALLQDGLVVAAVAEERLTRIKHSRSFPRKSIAYCLEYAGLKSTSDVDGIAIAWNPSENMLNINSSGFTDWRRYDPEWLYIVPNNLASTTNGLDIACDVLKMEFGITSKTPIYFVEHHLAHLAHAIYQSPYDKCLGVAIDEYSELHSMTLATFENNTLSIVRRFDYPHSLGVFYAAITEFLGFRPNSDEWKVMGAAAYGSPERYYSKLNEIFKWESSSNEWLLDCTYIEHSNMRRGGYCNKRLENYLGLPKREPSSPLLPVHYDLASSAQRIFETRILQLLNSYSHLSPRPNLAASGGCFMNSLANGKIINSTPFNSVFIPYAAADNGGAMGSALYVWHQTLSHAPSCALLPPTPYLGPEFSSDQIRSVLDSYKISYSISVDVAREAASLISSGLVIGWFQGRLEFGERALGSRSILADPRNPSMKTLLNEAIKFREGFRPFAPAILAEYVDDWFEIPPGESVPYMEKVYSFKPSKMTSVPAVVHQDGTGRLQTVDPVLHPLFHKLINEFFNLTSVPIVVNTSFNVQGEPIVCSPQDALRTFFTSGIDVLILGDHVIKKKLV